MSPTTIPKELEWAERIAGQLDSKFRLPGTNFRFGFDPIIGLIPFLGDSVTFVISSMLVLAMVRKKVSGKLLTLMIGNILLDTIIGSIPILGNIFDFAYKANQRNVRLMKRHYQEGKYQGSGVKTLVIFAILLIVLFALILLVFYWMIRGLIALF